MEPVTEQMKKEVMLQLSQDVQNLKVDVADLKDSMTGLAEAVARQTIKSGKKLTNIVVGCVI